MSVRRKSSRAMRKDSGGVDSYCSDSTVDKFENYTDLIDLDYSGDTRVHHLQHFLIDPNGWVQIKLHYSHLIRPETFAKPRERQYTARNYSDAVAQWWNESASYNTYGTCKRVDGNDCVDRYIVREFSDYDPRTSPLLKTHVYIQLNLDDINRHVRYEHAYFETAITHLISLINRDVTELFRLCPKLYRANKTIFPNGMDVQVRPRDAIYFRVPLGKFGSLLDAFAPSSPMTMRTLRYFLPSEAAVLKQQTVYPLHNHKLLESKLSNELLSHCSDIALRNFLTLSLPTGLYCLNYVKDLDIVIPLAHPRVPFFGSIYRTK